MLNHVSPPEPAIRECRRVLRPGGAMMVFQTFAGDSLERLEAARLYQMPGKLLPIGYLLQAPAAIDP